MTYPARGTWSFRNTDKSVFFWPVLDSINITNGNQRDNAVLSCSIVDPDNTQDFDVEDKIWVKFDGEYVFAGHIKAVTKTMLSEAGPRVFNIEAQDYTAKLDDSVIDNRRMRGAESVSARLNWILTFLNFGITTTNVNPPAGTCEKFNYEGYTVREALDQLCDEFNCEYYVDFEKDLHFFKAESINGPFDLTDLNANYTTTFPYTEFELRYDSVNLATAVYVNGHEKRWRWVTDATGISTYGRQERSVSDDDLRTVNQMERAGQRSLNQDSDIEIDGSCVVWQPGLRPGMHVDISCDLWNLTSERFLIVDSTITGVDPHGADNKAYMRCQINLLKIDDNKGRPKKKKSKKPVNKNSRRRIQGAIDHPALTQGTALTIIHQRRAADNLAGSSFSYGVSALYTIDSYVGQITSSATAGCGIVGLGMWGPEGSESESWYKVDCSGVADIASVLVVIPSMAGATGQALTQPVNVGWSNAEPTSLSMYTLMGQVPYTGGSVQIMASMINKTGDNFLVLAPGWRCARDFAVCSQYLSDPVNGPRVGGEGNSGRVTSPPPQDIGLYPMIAEEDGKTSWTTVRTVEEPDGSRTTFTLADWNGFGVPEVRLDAIIQAAQHDYTVDSDALTITFRQAPIIGMVLGFRYRRDA